MATATVRETLADGTIYWDVALNDGTIYIVAATTSSAAVTAAQTIQTANAVPVNNAATLRTRTQNALTTNATYLALANPSVAQNTAQVQNLTKECNALIRLLLSILDTTAGT